MKKILALLLVFTMAFVGCSSSWINTAIQDVPVVLQIVDSILGIVAVAQGRGQADASVVATVNQVAAESQSDLRLLQQLIAEYQAAPKDGKPAIAVKIDAVLQAAHQHLNDVMNAAHIKDQTTQLAVNAGLELAITTVAAIESLVPAPTSAAKKAKASLPQKPMSPKELKANFNKAVAAFPAAQIH